MVQFFIPARVRGSALYIRHCFFLRLARRFAPRNDESFIGAQRQASLFQRGDLGGMSICKQLNSKECPTKKKVTAQ